MKWYMQYQKTIIKKYLSLQLFSDCVCTINFQVLTHLHTFQFHLKIRLTLR